jgi:hypothetical protein
LLGPKEYMRDPILLPIGDELRGALWLLYLIISKPLNPKVMPLVPSGYGKLPLAMQVH